MSKHSKSKLRKIFSIVSNFSFVDNKTKSQNSSPGSETKASRRSGNGGGTKNDDVYDKKRDTSSRNGSIVNANNGDVKACHRGECSTSCVENENRPRKGSKPSTNSGGKAARISPTKSEVCSKTSFTSKRPSNDLACPSCDVIHCKHEVGFHCVVPDNDDVIADRSRRRTSSMDSSVVTSPDEAGDQDLFPRWQSFRLEGPRCSEEVELTEEQKAELKQAFSMFEKTGKGRIPARDLGELLRCLGWNPSEQDLEEARHELELSTRGTISFSEVEAYIARRGGIYYGNNAEEDIMVAFQVLDKTGSGRITVSDFRHFMTTMGERMTVEEAEELIARSTQDGKDYIEYRDLVQAVQHLPT